MWYHEQVRLPSDWLLPLATLGACGGAVGSPPPVSAPIVVDLPPAGAASSAAVAPAPPPTNSEPPTPTLLGEWEGIGHQSDGSSWTMQVEILSLSAGRCASVRYPSIPCATEWICSEASDGTGLRAHEQVTENRGVCIDGDVAMSLTPAGELEWHWAGKDAQGPVTAGAVLRRAK
jgi:hypothetical protein